MVYYTCYYSNCRRSVSPSVCNLPVCHYFAPCSIHRSSPISVTLTLPICHYHPAVITATHICKTAKPVDRAHQQAEISPFLLLLNRASFCLIFFLEKVCVLSIFFAVVASNNSNGTSKSSISRACILPVKLDVN